MDPAASVEDMSVVEENQSTKLTEDQYFSSYEDLEIHRLMVGDVPRTSAYRTAILDNPHLFKGKTVMDVGAGTGILSLFAAAAGAARVYAVEASGTAALLEQVARDNGFSEVITVLHSRVEDVVLPPDETVDVIISEWMGFYLLHESMLNSVLVARDRFLSEEGTIFPSEARIYACPCSLDDLYREQLDFWDDVYGFNMSAVRSSALDEKAKKPEVCIVKPEHLLAKPACIKTLNLRWVDAEEIANIAENVFVSITKAGSYHGICVWFECDFDGIDYDEEGEEFGKLVTLSTSPSSEPTHWKQTVVLLGKIGMVTNEKSQSESDTESTNVKNTVQLPANSQTVPTTRANSSYMKLEEDEVIGWRLEFVQSSGNLRHYTITLQMLDPETDEHPEPCLCSMPRCLIIAKFIENELEGKTFSDCSDRNANPATGAAKEK
uniref:type I protein arginine methyltransferase n=2 Tax=Hirondellea gigas TaxID=1518452 RepID=A0A6A7FM38_9CRUS